jgi:adenine-specific DNA-methyltransferase
MVARKAGKKPKKGKETRKKKREIEQYTHPQTKRVNNPPVGLVNPDTDRDAGKKTYAYDPHLDPCLQWTGKAERTSFEIPTVSLHIHERIDPRSIIEAVRKQNGKDFVQGSLFSMLEENPPLREAIDFYKHKHNWSNRLIAGDSLLVMNSLLEKEGMGDKVQMVYIDPPYGIKYGSNFQPFVNNRDVKDGKDEDLTAEPEMVKAFRDTWELDLHSYLSYMRDRFLLARDLLTESGSIFVQISDENVHHVREVLDEIFSKTNFVSMISFQTTSSLGGSLLGKSCDYLLWYARDISKIKFRQLFKPRNLNDDIGNRFTRVQLPDGTRRVMTTEERERPELLPKGSRIYRHDNLTSQSGGEHSAFPVNFQNQMFTPGKGFWKTNKEGFEKLAEANRLAAPTPNSLAYVRFLDDFPFRAFSNVWTDTQTGAFTDPKIYVVQTNAKVISRCLLMCTDPGDLVLDITCGSGTTAYVAENWGRRWITCDTSRVALALAKQRIMTAMFDYFELSHEEEGVDSGFRYNTVSHVTLRSIANREQPEQETLYDQPVIDTRKVRVTGPFTVEAVPAPVVRTIDELEEDGHPADNTVARSGETLRQGNWRDELLKTGIRGKGGQRIAFSRVEPFPGTKWLHAEAETREDRPQRVLVSFGPEHAPLEQRQVELALSEAETLRPKPEIVIFAAFQFDPEAAKDIDETNWPGVTLLKAQMNADLLTEDLKKKRASNESFWLIGQPDVDIDQVERGADKGKYRVRVNGFDYYNTQTGVIESGGSDKIAVWMLDTDYDGRSLFPRQVFFPIAGEGEGWAKLAKNLKAEIDEDRIEAYRGAVSLPFEAGKHTRAAVKIIDTRGVETLKLVNLE